jgi:hypothetical protein
MSVKLSKRIFGERCSCGGGLGLLQRNESWYAENARDQCKPRWPNHAKSRVGKVNDRSEDEQEGEKVKTKEEWDFRTLFALSWRRVPIINVSLCQMPSNHRYSYRSNHMGTVNGSAKDHNIFVRI